jgi:hypothetical protein
MKLGGDPPAAASPYPPHPRPARRRCAERRQQSEGPRWARAIKGARSPAARSTTSSICGYVDEINPVPSPSSRDPALHGVIFALLHSRACVGSPKPCRRTSRRRRSHSMDGRHRSGECRADAALWLAIQRDRAQGLSRRCRSRVNFGGHHHCKSSHDAQVAGGQARRAM